MYDRSASQKAIVYLKSGLYPCKTGGIEIFHYYFIKAMSRYYPAIILTQCDHEFDEDNIEVENIASPVGRLQTLFTLYNHIKFLVRFRDRIGLVHIPYSSGHLFQFYHVMALCKKFNIPYTLRISSSLMLPGRPDFMHAQYFRNASGIIAVSQPIKEEYERRYHQGILHIPSYLPFLETKLSRSDLREKYGIPSDHLVILCLGSVKELKGPDVLVGALEQLGCDYLKMKSVVTLFVGGGDMEHSLSERVSKAGMHAVIRFEGSVPYEKVHEYYAMSDLFVIPSLFEARPLALAEAIFNGLPTIGSDISTISNTINHGVDGLVFEKGNSEKLLECLKELIEDDDKRVAFGKNNVARRAEFNKFDDMVDEYVQYYAGILRKTR